MIEPMNTPWHLIAEASPPSISELRTPNSPLQSPASSLPRRLITAVLLLGALCLSGCSALRPGADPVVVRAEQATQAALVTFDTFLKIEHEQRAFYRTTMPEAHEFAEHLRKEGPKWLATARAMTRAYKANRSPDNKAGLATALAFLDAGLRQAQDYLVEAERKKGNP